jgi:hypothetical protein
MPVTTNLEHCIQRIASVRRQDGSVKVTFLDGSVARLDETHPHFDMLKALVPSDSQRWWPIGVMLDASGRVIDLNEANDVTVRYVREKKDSPERLHVALWGFSPMCYLVKHHPEFERLRSTLAAAAGTPVRLWVANHSQMVHDEPTTDDGEFEIWWKIMDVRPA